MKRWMIVLPVIALVVLWTVLGITTRARSQTRTLVYICQQAPCTNAQELQVSDGNGAPIFSVGEYGGPAVFGDNFKIFPPNTVYHPAVTESWESPAAYDRTFHLSASCSAPSVWLEPGGLWKCVTGRWVLRIRF